MYVITSTRPHLGNVLLVLDVLATQTHNLLLLAKGGIQDTYLFVSENYKTILFEWQCYVTSFV